MSELILLKEKFPNINITVSLEDLAKFGRYLIDETKREYERIEEKEQYLNQKQTAEMLEVDRNTLWRWNKQNYLNHIEIGGKHRYRLSDIKRILKMK